MKYTHLTVLDEDAGRIRPHNRLWRVRCDCGKVKLVRAGDVKAGKTRACGSCRFTAIMSMASKGNHGEGGQNYSREYVAWRAMIQRCEDPAHLGYKNYGGRGISICKRWRKSYQSFLSDMGRKPSRGHTMERIDGNDDYRPGNCRWATRAEQTRNTRNTHWVVFQGRRISLAEACEISGMKQGLASERISRGWIPSLAISIPPGKPGYRFGSEVRQ